MNKVHFFLTDSSLFSFQDSEKVVLVLYCAMQTNTIELPRYLFMQKVADVLKKKIVKFGRKL